MVKYIFSIVVLTIVLIFSSSDTFSGIPAPEGKIWVAEGGKTFANGVMVGIDDIPNGKRIYCKAAESCCWEITNGGKNLEVYTVSVPPKPGPIEDSETEITAVPEPINP